MRLHAQVAPFGRSRVVQSNPAQNQSREDEFHRESRQQIRSELPAKPDVLATEIVENLEARLESFKAIVAELGIKTLSIRQ